MSTVKKKFPFYSFNLMQRNSYVTRRQSMTVALSMIIIVLADWP